MIHRKHLVHMIALIVLLLISSCSPATTATTNLSPTESTDTPTIIPTSAPSSTPTPLQVPAIKTQCADNSKRVQKLDLQGVIAFQKPGKSQAFDFGFFLLNIRSRNTIKSVEDSSLARVSPDNKHLAYGYPIRSGEDENLRILDSTGKTISDFNSRIDGRLLRFYNWQNPEQLRIVQRDGFNLIVELINPFTQEHTLLRTDWNEVYIPADLSTDKRVLWKFDERATRVGDVYGANILYDPTLTRVVYPKENGMVSLVNAETEAELASAHFEDWGCIPSWSPNGEYLTILNREENVEEFYLISKDGNEFQRITDFAQEFDFVTIPEYTWSPNGRQIAFWLDTEHNEQEEGVGAQSELAVLDIPSRQVTRLCIQGMSSHANKPWTMYRPEPVWSPDGKYIMITQWDDPAKPRKYYVLVIDPVTGVFEKVSENTAPIGWMISEP